MGIQASFHSEDRRLGEARHRLRLASGMTSQSGDKTDVTVLNISSTGLLFQADRSLAVGDNILVELPEGGNCPAEIVWSDASYYGCRFVRPLDNIALNRARLKALPPDSTPATNEPAPGETPASSDETFAGRVLRLRKSRGLTQDELAEEVGVSKTTVWKWEHGAVRPRRKAFAGLALALGVSEAELRLGNSGGTDPRPGQVMLKDVVRSSREAIAAAALISPSDVSIQLTF